MKISDTIGCASRIRFFFHLTKISCTIDVLPSGKLPVLDSELRQVLRVRFNKQLAHVFVLTHVPGSGKTQHMMIPGKGLRSRDSGGLEPGADRAAALPQNTNAPIFLGGEPPPAIVAHVMAMRRSSRRVSVVVTAPTRTLGTQRLSSATSTPRWKNRARTPIVCTTSMSRIHGTAMAFSSMCALAAKVCREVAQVSTGVPRRV